MKKDLNFVADVIAVGGAMIGSSVIALNLGVNAIGYIAFLLSSIATVYLMIDSDVARSLKFVAWFYLAMNLIGIIRA